MNEIIYQGLVRVYLQGKNALIPILSGMELDGHIFYYIGDTTTNLILCDHRSEIVAETQQIFQTQHQNGFAKHFNQYAKAEVCYDEDTQRMKIDLHSAEVQSAKCPVLWMGVLEDNLMQRYEVEWEVFKTIDESNTAFIAFISPAN
jgi:hypothetical protein